MPDREKVVNCLTDIEQIMIVRQEICPREELQYWIELQEGVADAIALLKEQEAVKPKTDDAWPRRIKTCGSCGTCLFAVGDYKPKYCSECGRRVKWK